MSVVSLNGEAKQVSRLTKVVATRHHHKTEFQPKLCKEKKAFRGHGLIIEKIQKNFSSCARRGAAWKARGGILWDVAPGHSAA
jgi:hypothetical protein